MSNPIPRVFKLPIRETPPECFRLVGAIDTKVLLSGGIDTEVLALLGSQLRELDEDFEEVDSEEPKSIVFPWAESPRIYAPVPRRPQDLDFKILAENYEVPNLAEIEIKDEEKEEEINLHQPIPRRSRDLARTYY